MPLDIKNQQRIFNSRKGNERNSLEEILSHEQVYLFDYLFRMSGNANLAEAAAKAGVTQILRHGNFDSLAELRFRLYQFARNGCLSSWHDSVAKLEHSDLKEITISQESSKHTKNHAFFQLKINRTIGSANKLEREVLLLHIRSLFTFEKISLLMEISEANVEKIYNSIVSRLKTAHPEIEPKLREVIAALLPYPPPKPEIRTTTDLSQLIDGIDTPHRTPASLYLYFVLLFLFALFIALIGLLIMFLDNPNTIDQFKSSPIQYLKRILS